MMFLDCPAYLDQDGAAAPAYYLGRPARQWITIMGPRRTAGAPAGAPRPVLGGRAR